MDLTQLLENVKTGQIDIDEPRHKKHRIFIRLDSKSRSQGLGYPDLLLDLPGNYPGHDFGGLDHNGEPVDSPNLRFRGIETFNVNFSP